MYCSNCKYYKNANIANVLGYHDDCMCINPDSDYNGCIVPDTNWCNEFEWKDKKGEDCMKINVILDEGAKMPTKAHFTDAGFDLYSPKRIEMHGRGDAVIDTGVHFEIPAGYVGFIKSKSGLNVRKGIVTEGVIDSGYTGSVVVKLYNNSNDYIIIEEGQKLTQIVFLPIPTVQLVEVTEFEETERGNGGFGSTGKF